MRFWLTKMNIDCKMYDMKPLTTFEAAKFLGVSTRTIYRLIEDKKLNPYKVKKHFRYDVAELEKFKKDNKIYK